MKNYLPILAIETSDNICGACVYFDEKKHFSSKIILKHAHSEKLFEIVESVIKQAAIPKEELNSIAVSAGPGSFTGLRIGMAAAKGMAEALNIPIIPVPTFEALALQISNYLPEKFCFIITNKVGRDELYFAEFQIKGNSYIFKQELKIVPNIVENFHKNEDLLFGNALALKATSQNYKNISAPDPLYVAKWAINFGLEDAVSDVDFIEPNYLKEFIVKEKKI